MLKAIFNNITSNDKNQTINKLIENSSPRKDFFIMTALSALMASFGILLNNTPILIGAMLIAPLLYSILSLGLGIVILDKKLIIRSIITVSKSFALCICLSAGTGLIFRGKAQNIGNFFLFAENTSTAYFIVAIISGLAGSLATIKPNMNEAMPGVAISVALVPPISALGIALPLLDPIIIRHFFDIFAINVIGILISSIFTFSAYNFYYCRKTIKKAIKRDDKIIAKQTATTK
ncbi:TIGR00341 family protein [Candidatus Parcubacteria bacterium 4484_255]|nr:MAG: TIGR00341 family protein [Candidatus Parcubacteria bacterium 4484_255]